MVEQEFSVDAGTKEKVNTSRGTYRLTPQKERAKFYYALFSESGFDAKITAKAGTLDEICLYDLETIVNLK